MIKLRSVCLWIYRQGLWHWLTGVWVGAWALWIFLCWKGMVKM